MKLVKKSNKTVTLEFSEVELSVLANALNEAFEAVEAWEFSSRVGVEVQAAEAIHKALLSVLDGKVGETPPSEV